MGFEQNGLHIVKCWNIVVVCDMVVWLNYYLSQTDDIIMYGN